MSGFKLLNDRLTFEKRDDDTLTAEEAQVIALMDQTSFLEEISQQLSGLTKLIALK